MDPPQEHIYIYIGSFEWWLGRARGDVATTRSPCEHLGREEKRGRGEMTLDAGRGSTTPPGETNDGRTTLEGNELADTVR